MTKISELKVGQGKADVTGTVKNIGETRSFNKFGKELKVANALLEDDSGAIKLSLWNDDVMRVKEGCTLKIMNGFVNEFNGEKQLTTGKFGKMEIISGEESAEAGNAASSDEEGLL